jgi:hypothetical protein
LDIFTFSIPVYKKPGEKEKIGKSDLLINKKSRSENERALRSAINL